MKSKQIRDVIIGLLLLSTHGISVFIVSCSQDDDLLSISSRSNPGYHYSGESSAYSTAIATTFKYVGQGAAKETGEIGMGWALGAMGLTSSSFNWQTELSIISAQLDSIIRLLAVADDELSSIDSILNVINCTLEETSLQSELAAIQTYYNTYNTFLLTAQEGDTIPNADMLAFSNDVINGSGSMPSVEDALNNIAVNINEQSGVIVACMQSIPKPGSGTIALDTLYYQQVQSLLNKYYYYQTIGLTLRNLARSSS